MTTRERIALVRRLYIQRNGKEPKSIILGDEIFDEIRDEIYPRSVDGHAVYLGMIVYTDKDKPLRVEVGNIS